MSIKFYERRLAALALAFLLSGCAATAALQGANPSSISGTAAGLFGIPAATVSGQMSAEISQIGMIAQQIQMLKAQLDGTPITLPTLPVTPMTPAPPISVPMTPVPTPGGPIVTPN